MKNDAGRIENDDEVIITDKSDADQIPAGMVKEEDTWDQESKTQVLCKGCESSSLNTTIKLCSGKSILTTKANLWCMWG